MYGGLWADLLRHRTELKGFLGWMDRHHQVVASIAKKVRQFYDRKESFRIYHGSTNSTRQAKFPRSKTVDTSDLSDVLEVDVERKVALVEPNVPMDQLVKATLRYGLIPPVVMEFPGITAGGGFAGTSGESSSFKHGFFDNTVNWIEVVLASGDVVAVSDTKSPDLFYGAAGSFGTLCITTLLEIQLIEAKIYVELTYLPVYNVFVSIQKLEEAIADPSNDYIDGILFSLNRGVIMTGHLTNVPKDGMKIQRFSRARDPWFYLHAKEKLSKNNTNPSTEVIPLEDYLFRYDRGAFWTGFYAFQYFMTPFNRFTRWLLDPFMHTRVMYHALHASDHAQQYIIQDLALPKSTAQQFIEYIDKEFKFYPLWLCPLRNNNHISLHPRSLIPLEDSSTKKAMLLNIGVWGPGPREPDQFAELNRKLERKLHELSGMKWLYAQAYYTEEEFWEIYDRDWYDKLRLKYNATSWPSIFEKVRVDLDAQKRAYGGVWAVWPFSGLYGVLRAAVGGDYVLASEGGRLRVLGFLVLLVGVVVAIVFEWIHFAR